jgi:tetratricopeptide (TPR) repeat protein
MAKNSQDTNPKSVSNVEETLSRTEQFLEQNYKQLIYVLAGVIVLVGIFWLAKIYLNKRNDDAQAQMYQAQKYLESDSLKLALNGDGNYLGFLDIAKEYKMTPAGNLSLYCAGICYLHLGQYQDAIDYLSKYSKKDKMIGSLAIGATGDAYVELGDTQKGVAKYLEAANYAKNSFNTPIYLMKAGEIYELNKNYDDALKMYQRIKDEYPESTEGLTIDKYIARVKLFVK